MTIGKNNVTISQAEEKDFDGIQQFYYDVIDGFEGEKYHPCWQKDVYPSKEQLLNFIKSGEMFIGTENGEIASVMALNHVYNEEYDKANWQISAKKSEIFVIHVLAVHPSRLHRGIAGATLRFAINYSRKNGGRTVRLDVLKGNYPAVKLYEKAGFQKVDTLTMYYPDTGNTDFELYELIL